MIPHDEVRGVPDFAERQKAFERAAEDVIEALKKNGAQIGDLDEVFGHVRAILGRREI